MYIWALKASYSFMENQHDLKFWLTLPYKAHRIAYMTLHA